MAAPFQKEVANLIRARYPVLHVVTWEEDRAMHLLSAIAGKLDKSLFAWSITDGLHWVAGTKANCERIREPLKVLNEVLQWSGPALFVLKDFHAYLEAPEIVRQVRDLGLALRKSYKTLIILSPTPKIPPELEKTITLVDLPLPSTGELLDLLRNTARSAAATGHFEVDLDETSMRSLSEAARGLTLGEAESAFAKAIVNDRKLDADDLASIIEEKKQIIRKSGLLEYYDAAGGLDGVGGMDILKDWLRKRTRAFTEEARRYGLPQPKGMLLLGVQGCGKSLVAKSVSNAWRLPLLRMDMSRIFQGHIGSSEDNMRRALLMAQTLAPIILWVDEIEKAFSGLEGSSGTDGGTTARVIGQFLTWMQEKEEPVFVVATANSVKGLPPELLRKGRLDEIFFVDLPRAAERADILRIHLARFGRNPDAYDLKKLVPAAHGFSGAEIEQAIVSALYDSFFAGRELNTEDLLQSFAETVPLSRTMREEISELRGWASERARPVSSQQYKPVTQIGPAP